MKRFIFLLLAVVMLLSLTACGDNKNNGSMTEPTASPSMSPIVSPDVSDGMVNGECRRDPVRQRESVIFS